MSNHMYLFVLVIKGKEEKADCGSAVCLSENDINGLSCVLVQAKCKGEV